MQPVVPLDSKVNSADVEALLAGLTSISLELTNTCNLSCVHCYAGSSPRAPLYEGMTFRDWEAVLQQSAALGCKTVRFIGGEPAVYPQLVELIAVARQLEFENLFLYTNGTHLTERLRAALVEYDVGLAFSLYAASADAHDAVTGVRGSFSQTLDSIGWAISEGLKVRVAITRIAAPAEISAAASMVRRMGVRNVSFDRVRRIGRGGGDSPHEDVDELCGSCWEGKLCVSPSGSIHPCVFSRFEQVGSTTEGIAEAVSSPALRNFRGRVFAMVQKRRGKPPVMNLSSDYDTCDPEQDPGQCGPETEPGPCDPEKNPGPCGPETDPGPCDPEKDPGPCGPEQPS
jgi:MoaA/NifB/PqqE/SkfB family radical SAM enzyme